MIKTYLMTKHGIKQDVPLDGWKSTAKGDRALLWVDVGAPSGDEIGRPADVFGLHSVAVDSICCFGKPFSRNRRAHSLFGLQHLQPQFGSGFAYYTRIRLRDTQSCFQILACSPTDQKPEDGLATILRLLFDLIELSARFTELWIIQGSRTWE